MCSWNVLCSERCVVVDILFFRVDGDLNFSDMVLINRIHDYLGSILLVSTLGSAILGPV